MFSVCEIINKMKRKELELIDQYLEGTLTQQATATFDQRLCVDKKFRLDFEEIKLIIKGIRYSAFVDELSRIKQINRFLEQGGILLRHNIDDKVENVIEDLTIDRDWRVVLICGNKDDCMGIIRKLIKKHPAKFQTMETYNGYFRPRIISSGILKEPVAQMDIIDHHGIFNLGLI
jgi:hypothetical protein